jgi:nitroreductase
VNCELGTQEGCRSLSEVSKNPVLEAIHSRRSARAYTAKPLARETLTAIIEAGRAAPSGGNNQTTHFLVITAPQVLADLKELTVSAFSAMEATPDLYKSLRGSILQAKKGGYDFLYGAPVLIVTANRKGYGNAMADCACALENMMLAATALQVGSCWINQLKWLNEDAPLRAYLEARGLTKEEDICGGLALGYTDRPAPPPLERFGNPVTIIA